MLDKKQLLEFGPPCLDYNCPKKDSCRRHAKGEERSSAYFYSYKLSFEDECWAYDPDDRTLIRKMMQLDG